jgi:Ca2+/Na+ antiporter
MNKQLKTKKQIQQIKRDISFSLCGILVFFYFLFAIFYHEIKVFLVVYFLMLLTIALTIFYQMINNTITIELKNEG